MKLLITLLPLMLLIAGVVFAYRYPLSRSVHARLYAFLNDRRENRADAAEEQWLREQLG